MELNFLPILNKCCCCIPLRIGALCIGYFCLLVSITSISFISVSIYKVAEYVRTHAGRPDLGHTEEEMRSTAIGLYISQAYFILVFLFCLAINLVLVIGVHKNNARLVRHYVAAGVMLLVLELALIVLTSVFFGVLASLPLLKWSVILFYFIIVVRSACLEIEEREKPAVYPLYDIRPPAPSQQPLIA